MWGQYQNHQRKLPHFTRLSGVLLPVSEMHMGDYSSRTEPEDLDQLQPTLWPGRQRVQVSVQYSLFSVEVRHLLALLEHLQDVQLVWSREPASVLGFFQCWFQKGFPKAFFYVCVNVLTLVCVGVSSTHCAGRSVMQKGETIRYWQLVFYFHIMIQQLTHGLVAAACFHWVQCSLAPLFLLLVPSVSFVCAGGSEGRHCTVRVWPTLLLYPIHPDSLPPGVLCVRSMPCINGTVYQDLYLFMAL